MPGQTRDLRAPAGLGDRPHLDRVGAAGDLFFVAMNVHGSLLGCRVRLGGKSGRKREDRLSHASTQ